MSLEEFVNGSIAYLNLPIYEDDVIERNGGICMYEGVAFKYNQRIGLHIACVITHRDITISTYSKAWDYHI